MICPLKQKGPFIYDKPKALMHECIKQSPNKVRGVTPRGYHGLNFHCDNEA
jgi:hypothetical protein